MNYAIFKLTAASALIALLFVSVAQADNPYVINRDHGGRMIAYRTFWSRVHSQYDSVVVNGDCHSACTMLFYYFPLDKVCITPRASFGFHAAHLKNDKRVINERGTLMFKQMYSGPIKTWVDNHHALDSTKLQIMSNAEARRFLKPCAVPAGWKPRKDLLAIINEGRKSSRDTNIPNAGSTAQANVKNNKPRGKRGN